MDDDEKKLCAGYLRTMVAHLKSMDGAAMDADGVCAYRGVGGQKCLVGALIPDDVYHEGFEGSSVDDLYDIQGYADIGFCIPSEEVAQFLNACQSAHDRTKRQSGGIFRSAVERRLRDIALDYGVAWPGEED